MGEKIMLRDFRMTANELADVATQLAFRIRDGLEKDGCEIKALPTYISSQASPSGEAVVVDLGGTNLRAARVRLAGGELEVLAGPVTDALPVRRGEPLSKERFLDCQVSLVKRLGPCDGLPLGYCFSYPASSTPSGDARLLHWTKEVEIPGTEGVLVGKLLLDALTASGVRLSRVSVVNDTVASLLAGVALGEADGYLGLIVGTGTNMALSMKTTAIPKLGEEHRRLGFMPVNLESGNFAPPHLNQFDDELDQRSTDPGQQRFEKAVSGAYLGRLLALAAPELSFDPESGAQGVVALASQGLGGELPAAILQRSADLVAASLAGGMAAMNEGVERRDLSILAEGGLFWGAPGYAQRVSGTLESVLMEIGLSHLSFRLQSASQANLVGAATGALA